MEEKKPVVNFDSLVKLKRSSYDIGTVGKKGIGKTLLESVYGFYKQRKQGYIVYSNYPLNYPHIFIDNISDFNKILSSDVNKPKIFLGDDFERWFHSRNTKSKTNIELNEILLDFGKVSCSVFFSQKRSMSVDLGMRDSASEWWIPSLQLAYITNDQNLNNKLKKYLNFLCLNVQRFDDQLQPLGTFQIHNLQHHVKLFDTTTIIPPIKTNMH